MKNCQQKPALTLIHNTESKGDRKFMNVWILRTRRYAKESYHEHITRVYLLSYARFRIIL